LVAKGWDLLDVEDKPVALSPDCLLAIAFDPVPREFPAASAFHNGMPVSKEEFDKLVAASAAKP
jgi:hypothetical protein